MAMSDTLFEPKLTFPPGPKPRFRAVVRPGCFGEKEYEFFTLLGAEGFADNARASGEIKSHEGVHIFDDSGCLVKKAQRYDNQART
jgi:hypothetical protein